MRGSCSLRPLPLWRSRSCSLKLIVGKRSVHFSTIRACFGMNTKIAYGIIFQELEKYSPTGDAVESEDDMINLAEQNKVWNLLVAPKFFPIFVIHFTPLSLFPRKLCLCS